MENFFYDSEYCSSIEDLIYKVVDDEDEIYELEDDWEIKCYKSNFEKLEEIDEYWITQRMDEDRFPEDDERTVDKLLKLFKDNINFEKINEQMPKLYYENGKSFMITKQDLINYIK